MPRDNAVQQFGLLIAYLLPGTVVLWGASFLWEAPRVWFGMAPAQAPTVGGAMVLTVAAAGAGMVVSLLRWLLIDALHHATGLHAPEWDFARLSGRVEALEMLVEGHYRYYQSAANGLVAVAAAFVCWRMSANARTVPLGSVDLAVVLLELLLFAGSRDALRNYYARAGRLLAGRRRGRGAGFSAASGASSRRRPGSRTPPT